MVSNQFSMIDWSWAKVYKKEVKSCVPALIFLNSMSSAFIFQCHNYQKTMSKFVKLKRQNYGNPKVILLTDKFYNLGTFICSITNLKHFEYYEKYHSVIHVHVVYVYHWEFLSVYINIYKQCMYSTHNVIFHIHILSCVISIVLSE